MHILGKISACLILGWISAIDFKPSTMFRVGVAKLKASVYNPMFGLVFVIPPVWHTLYELKKRRLSCLAWS